MTHDLVSAYGMLDKMKVLVSIALCRILDLLFCFLISQRDPEDRHLKT